MHQIVEICLGGIDFGCIGFDLIKCFLSFFDGELAVFQECSFFLKLDKSWFLFMGELF